MKKYKSKKNRDYSLQFLPKKLEEISKSKTVYFKGKNIKTAYLVDMVHSLILKYYFTKRDSFNLYSMILRQRYTKNYNYYIDWLEHNGIIKMVSNYKNGSKSRTYKLNKDIIDNVITRYRNEDKILNKKLLNNLNGVDFEEVENNLILPDIKNKLISDLYDISIDMERSMFFLDCTIQDKDTYNRNHYAIECIKEKQIFFHFDEYGRLHTNYTILKGFIRKNCLLIDDEPTVELDIKNSQPLFLCKLIETDGRLMVNEKEFEFFKKITKDGNYYDFILSRTDLKTKKEAKEMTYKVFFGKNLNSKFDKMFKDIFPSIYSFIKEYKYCNENYRRLAHDLQRYESNFIFNKVVKELVDTYPKIKLFTVHDSIIVPKSYKELAESIFYRNLNEEFGIKEVLELEF